MKPAEHAPRQIGAEQQRCTGGASQPPGWLTRFTALPLCRFVASTRGDLVWHALIVITVLLPLASLSIDIPRYFILKSRLHLAADGAAEAAARSLDINHFRETGEVRLSGNAYHEARWATASLVSMEPSGFTATLDRFRVDEGADTVTVGLSGTTHLFFGLSPAIRVQAEATSRFRMDQR